MKRKYDVISDFFNDFIYINKSTKPTLEEILIIPKKNFYFNIKGKGKELELEKGKLYKGFYIHSRYERELRIVNELGINTSYFEMSKFIIDKQKIREIRLKGLLE